MTREEAITELTVHLGHWKRLKEEHIASVEESNRMIDALNMAIEALANGYVVHKEYKTFCGVPMEEAIEVIEEYKEQTTPTIPCFTESAEAYKAWTGEEMGGTSKRQNVAYICDKRRCDKEGCSNCGRTTDIEHAKNFELINNTYYERW